MASSRCLSVWYWWHPLWPSLLPFFLSRSQGRGSSDDDWRCDNRQGDGGSQNKGVDLGDNNKQIKHVFVVGMEWLCEELRAADLSTVSIPDTTEPYFILRDKLVVHDFEGLYYNNNNNDGGMTITNQDVDAVVVGLDTEFLYCKLCVATVLLQRFPNAPLVAMN
jgi:ribonucleotide monophosphatase NagD (HAD superfamily)